METLEYEAYMCVIYSNNSSLSVNDGIEILQHGSSKGNTPYIATSKQTLRKEDEALIAMKTYSKAYDDVLKQCGGPLKFTSQSLEPRDIKQLYNRKQRKTESLNQVNNNSVTGDIIHVLNKQKSNNYLSSVIVQKEAYFFFMASHTQLDDIYFVRLSFSDLMI